MWRFAMPTDKGPTSALVVGPTGDRQFGDLCLFDFHQSALHALDNLKKRQCRGRMAFRPATANGDGSG